MPGSLECDNMTERSVFLEALEHSDPAARAAFLDRICSGRPCLRRRVEELLQSHVQADRFLDVPALEQMAAADQSLAFLAPPSEPGSLGRLDHYEVLQVVGRGSAGMVLKARDSKLQRIVAIKVLAPRLVASAAARAGFVREAQAAAAVRDDHVVAIHAVNDEGPVPYLVMEYISGMTLEERLREGKALELKEILRIGMQVAAGLAAAHAQGLAHRDIKPANILLENGVQRVKIADFGLAGLGDAGTPTTGKVLAGTPPFMSPEQARGELSDFRTDLFSLGSVLYTLCARQPPFGGATAAEIMKAVCADEPAPLRPGKAAVPEWLCQTIDKLHAKRPEDRFPSAQAVADLLSSQLALLQQPHLNAAPGSIPVPSEKANSAALERTPPVRARRLVVFLLVAGVIALAIVFALVRPWDGATSTPEPVRRTPRTKPVFQPLDLRPDAIPPMHLVLAGGGDAKKAPPELVRVLGDWQFQLPQAGQTAWMEQSPDGKLLAVPCDADVVLFTCPDGRYWKTLKGTPERVIAVRFSPDGRLLAASVRIESRWSQAIRVWELESGRDLFTHPLGNSQVYGGLVFSPDSKRLLVEHDQQVYVWDARSGREVQRVEVKPGGVHTMRFSPDGRRLALPIFHAKGGRLFDWDGDRLGAVHTLAGHQDAVMDVAFSPDGKLLASGDRHAFKIWNASTLEEIRTVEAPGERLLFAPDSTLYAATTTTIPKTVYTVRRWRPEGVELPALSLEIAADPVHAYFCLSKDGKVLFAAPRWKLTHVRAIDTDTGKEIYPRRGHSAPLSAVAIHPGGKIVASAGDDRRIKLWDLASAQVVRALASQPEALTSLAFSPAGDLLASVSRDGTLALWDAEDGNLLHTLPGHARLKARLAFSPDGQAVAAGTDSGEVKIWDATLGTERQRLRGHAGGVRCVAFSTDGSYLASAGEDRSVCVHELAGGNLRKLSAPSGINDLAFSRDGRLLAAAADGPRSGVRLWELASARERVLEGHLGRVNGLAFSPATPLLATCGEDGTVRFWNVADGALLRTIGPGSFGGPVGSVAFTPDGRYLLTANANGTVYGLQVE